jgi:regulator of sigma E protease
MSWLLFIPILLVMVLIHEAGHFFTARLFGVKVLEFGVGFPPKAWSRVSKKSGIEYSVNWLPIGGFVRMEGENGDSDDPNSFGRKATWQRAIILGAGPFMNLVLAFLVYIILSTGGSDTSKGLPSLLTVAPGSPAAKAGLQVGDVILNVNSDAVKNTSDILVDIAVNRSQPFDLTILRNGQTQHLTVKARTPDQTPAGEGGLGISLANQYPLAADPFKISSNLHGSDGKVLLDKDGNPLLKDGDIITTVDGQTFTTDIDLVTYLTTVTSDSVVLNITRTTAGQTQTLPVTVPVQAYILASYPNSSTAKAKVPDLSPILALDNTLIHTRNQYLDYLKTHAGTLVNLTYYDTKEQASKTVSILANLPTDGNQTVAESNKDWSPLVAQRLDSQTVSIPLSVYPVLVHKDFTPAEMVGNAWDQTIYAIGLIPRTFNGLFNGSVSVKQLAGPIGMANITSNIVEQGGLARLLPNLLTLLALLSVNLGIVNLLPLPALDGGRLVFVIIEMITRGRRVPPEKEGLIHLVGMVMLLTLMVLISWNDISRLLSGGAFS